MGQRHTLVHRLADYAACRPDAPAIHQKAASGGWETYTWKQYWEAAREIAKGLIALGHEAGECVAIVGESRVEWVLCELGIMAARGIPAPIYTNSTPEQTAYIVKHAQAKIAIADTADRLARYREARDAGLMEASVFILMDEPGDAAGDDVRSVAALRELGRAESDDALEARLAEMREDDVALLIYTSGTTGVPKAVQLDHAGIVQMTEGLLDNFPMLRGDTPYRVVSYLPLSHVAEQAATNFAQLSTGGEAYFCPAITEIKDYLTMVRPTVFLGVPRVWEKFQAALEAKLGQATGLKAFLASWARKTELAAFEAEVKTGEPVHTLGRRLAHKLVISKVKGALGLDQLVLAVTGAAPIARGTLDFFASLGIVIYEAYGMSETSGIATMQKFGSPRFGTVGQSLTCNEVRIAADGEILLRGRNMTRGYLHMDEQTAELYEDGDEWLHTGDLGSLDADGFLKITGRKKDLLITAGGKNVAPAEMEAHISQIQGVGQVVVVGDRKPYLTALVTLDPESLDLLAKAAGVDTAPLPELASKPQVHDHLMGQIEAGCNQAVARYQTIKKIRVLDHEFSVEGGEMTPSMKVKRNVVTERYADAIESMYS